MGIFDANFFCNKLLLNTYTTGTTGPRVLPVSSLTQTNCLVLMPTLLESEGRSKRYPFVEIVDHLLHEG